MNNKKLSEIKFNKRQIWQVVFTAMTASALMAVDENGQKIVGAIEKEVPELVQQELKEVIGELREGIKQQMVEGIKQEQIMLRQGVERIKQEQTMLRQGVEEEATLRIRVMEEIDRISRQQQRIILELKRLERNNIIFQERRALMEEWEILRNSQSEAEMQRLIPRLQRSITRSEELIAERIRLDAEQRGLISELIEAWVRFS